MQYRITTRGLRLVASSLLTATVVFFAQAAVAAAANRPEADAPPRIAITEQGLAPKKAVTGSGHAFVLESGVEGPVVVAFALLDGQRVACASPGRTPRLGQVFAVAPGSRLICHALPGRYAFVADHPLHLASGIWVNHLTGWIEIS
jgi:hypothetical protein